MGNANYSGERRADEKERAMIMDRLASSVEVMVKQSGEQTKMITDLAKEMGDVKVDIQRVMIGQKSFLKSYDKQVGSCIKIQDDFEERLRHIPEHKCLNEKRIETLEEDSGELTKNMYKFMGILSVVFLLITIFGPWALKKWGG